MNIKRFFIIYLISFGFGSGILGQEFDIKVKMQIAPTIRLLSEKSFVENVIGKSIQDLFNGTKWGDDIFKPHEKIKGTITVNIKNEPLLGAFEAEILFQTQRPVFNSSYESIMLSIGDQFVSFVFNENQLNLNKTNNAFTDNLSAIISFYAYIALGMDFDSYKVNGGDPYFKRAHEIILSLPSGIANEQGWRGDKTFGTNRFWLLENLQNPIFRQFRQSNYEYHRLGLDKMYDDVDKSKAVILSALTSIGQSNIEYPNSYMIELFCNTKKDEILEIFKVADKGQKEKVKNIMVSMDILRRQQYESLIQN